MSGGWESPQACVVESMVGGASNRSYERVRAGDRSWVVMVLADEPIRSEEAMSGPVAEELPFLEIQRFLSERGVSVPAVHHIDEAGGRLWLDDLGDETLLSILQERPPAEWVESYKPALRLLTDFQRATAGDHERPICYQRAFEAPLLRWELDHYREWRLETQLGHTLSPATLEALGEAFDDLVRSLITAPRILCHRDFQSTNLMMAPCKGLVLIDFQDALMGPWTYDLVSLLRDSYVPLAGPQLDALVDHYLWLNDHLDAPAFWRSFHEQTVQRKLKDSGRFVYIDRVKQNPAWLGYIDDSLGYVRDALERLPHRSRLLELLADLDPAFR